jgi:hypothetical protein
MTESNEASQNDLPETPKEPRSLQELKGAMAEVEETLASAVNSLITEKPERSLLARQAEWHIKGLVYHYGRLFDLYNTVANEVGSRALGLNADIYVMHSPEMQDLIFEFYALVNLARITLDESIKYVRSLFTKSTHLPKSINDFLHGQSDCPLWHRLNSIQPLLTYLVDIRNCVVHYRTFATSDNTVAIRELGRRWRIGRNKRCGV